MKQPNPGSGAMSREFTAFARRLGISSAAATAALLVAYAVALAGLVGVAVGDMQVRNLGVVGYVGVFLVACVLLAILFQRTTPVAARESESVGG